MGGIIILLTPAFIKDPFRAWNHRISLDLRLVHSGREKSALSCLSETEKEGGEGETLSCWLLLHITPPKPAQL